MSMEKWAVKLDAFLGFNEHEILQAAGRVWRELAKQTAESTMNE